MKKAEEIIAEVKEILSTRWKRRKGTVVPKPEAITLGNDAVALEGTVLYADMADSTALVNGFKDWFAAEVYKAFLISASYLIRNNSGEITAFDGDRVMGVYVGSGKNTSAAKTALQINWAVRQINSKIKSAFPNTSFTLRHSVGIDTSSLFVARTGIRNSNDLVWVGRAANYAAKLSEISDTTAQSFITETVFKNLNVSAKNAGTPRRSMWEKSHWQDGNLPIYKSNWYWKPK
jgi:class 3 adenylate cyclase